MYIWIFYINNFTWFLCNSSLQWWLWGFSFWTYICFCFDSVLIVVHGAALKYLLVFLRGSRVKLWDFFLQNSALIWPRWYSPNVNDDVCPEFVFCPFCFCCFILFSELTSPCPGLMLVMCTSSRQAMSLFKGSEVVWTVFSQTLFRARDWNTHKRKIMSRSDNWLIIQVILSRKKSKYLMLPVSQIWEFVTFLGLL